MGKRSSFERIDKDAYQTIDRRAVMALLPHLATSVGFCEPCMGDGILLEDLESYGHTCIWGSDIKTGIDVFSLTSQDLNQCDMVITNPPWSRHILHPLIQHLSALKPTWLLFDSDWSHTKQSSQLIKDLCTDIVSVGRLIWIPGTKVSGKDNVSWYCFNVDKNDYTKFHGR